MLAIEWQISRICNHVPFQPTITKFCTWGWVVEWGWVVDVITDANFPKNWQMSFGVTCPLEWHFLYLTFTTLTTVSALLCCTIRWSPLTHAITNISVQHLARYILYPSQHIINYFEDGHLRQSLAFALTMSGW